MSTTPLAWQAVNRKYVYMFYFKIKELKNEVKKS